MVVLSKEPYTTTTEPAVVTDRLRSFPVPPNVTRHNTDPVPGNCKVRQRSEHTQLPESVEMRNPSLAPKPGTALWEPMLKLLPENHPAEKRLFDSIDEAVTCTSPVLLTLMAVSVPNVPGKQD